MSAVIRKTLLHVETTLIGGKAATVPLADRRCGGGEELWGWGRSKPEACDP